MGYTGALLLAEQHLSDGELDIKVNKTSHDFIRGPIQSRHTSARKYFLWIKINQDNLKDPIVGWYCECKGVRVQLVVHMLRQ